MSIPLAPLRSMKGDMSIPLAPLRFAKGGVSPVIPAEVGIQRCREIEDQSRLKSV